MKRFGMPSGCEKRYIKTGYYYYYYHPVHELESALLVQRLKSSRLHAQTIGQRNGTKARWNAEMTSLNSTLASGLVDIWLLSLKSEIGSAAVLTISPRHSQQLPWCPVLLLWCPLQCFSTSSHCPHRRAPEKSCCAPTRVNFKDLLLCK